MDRIGKTMGTDSKTMSKTKTMSQTKTFNEFFECLERIQLEICT